MPRAPTLESLKSRGPQASASSRELRSPGSEGRPGRVPPSGGPPSRGPGAVPLRWPLIAVVVLGFLAWLLPAIYAVYRLRTLAASTADYAQCMAGPTAPQLIQAGQSGYELLLRRRLLAAPANARPFQDCAKLASELGADEETVLVHQLQSFEFREYLGLPDGAGSLETLSLSRAQLEAWADKASIFCPRDWTSLIVAQAHSKVAPHPQGVPLPSLGSGLALGQSMVKNTQRFGQLIRTSLHHAGQSLELVSRDGGLNWQTGKDLEPSAACLSEAGHSYLLSVTRGDERVVLSAGGDTQASVARLGSKKDQVLSVACDDQLIQVLLLPAPGADGQLASPPPRLRSCAFRGACEELALPTFAGRPVGEELELGRVGGVTVLVLVRQGLTRVASSRDGGRSYTPWTLVYDREQMPAQLRLPPPSRLLRIADELWLYGAPGDGGRQLVLRSQDQGASFLPPRL